MATFGTTNKYINYAVYAQEISVNNSNNTSVVRVWVDVWRTNTGFTTYGNGTVYARVNGSLKSASITSSQKITSTAIRLGTWDTTITHDNNGSKTISVSGWISHDRFSSSEQGFNFTLTTIPRAATITACNDFKDTDNPSFTFSNPGNWNMQCWLEPNPNGDHLCERTISGTSGTYTWTLTDTERNQLREACKGKTCTIRVGLYSKDKTWASYKDKTYTITNAEPTIDTISTSIVNPFGEICLQGKSSVKITVDSVTCKYGATVTNYAISGDSISYSGSTNNGTTGVLNSPGTHTYTVTVTDSRGFTATKTISLDVTEYIYPTLTVEAFRSDSNGTKDNINGSYITIIPTFTYCNIVGNSISSKSLKIDNVSKNSSFASGKSYTFSDYGLDTTHTIEVIIKDTVGNSTSYSLEIGIGKVPFHIPLHKNGMGVGRYCDTEGELQVGYLANFFNGLAINGVNFIDFIYPIGSQIYNSDKNFDPNTYYEGTTWIRIKGYVLGGINEDDTDTDEHISFNQDAGTVIGNKYLQKHSHVVPIKSASSEATGYGLTKSDAFLNRVAVTGNGVASGNYGDGDSQNIQPTQLTYIWERTA